MSESRTITLTINGTTRSFLSTPEKSLLRLLREAGYTEVKCGCEEGDCGTCTVLLDGRSVKSCVTLACACEGHTIWTTRGLSHRDRIGQKLHAAFVRFGASQCGFCTPGMMACGIGYLMNDGRADRALIRKAISGNLCRCTGYKKIIDAIYFVASELEQEKEGAPS